jgi:hypothetical protein
LSGVTVFDLSTWYILAGVEAGGLDRLKYLLQAAGVDPQPDFLAETLFLGSIIMSLVYAGCDGHLISTAWR